MPRRWRLRWGGRCTRWRTPWSLMSLLRSGKGSSCALIDPVKGVKHLASALRKHRFCLPVPMLWKFCMTKRAIIYINWILVIRQHQPISHILFTCLHVLVFVAVCIWLTKSKCHVTSVLVAENRKGGNTIATESPRSTSDDLPFNMALQQWFVKALSIHDLFTKRRPHLACYFIFLLQPLLIRLYIFLFSLESFSNDAFRTRWKIASRCSALNYAYALAS